VESLFYDDGEEIGWTNKREGKAMLESGSRWEKD
jgi:hypothetical protein